MRRACLEARLGEHLISARRDERAANPEQRVSRFAGTRPKNRQTQFGLSVGTFRFLEMWELIQIAGFYNPTLNCGNSHVYESYKRLEERI